MRHNKFFNTTDFRDSNTQVDNNPNNNKNSKKNTEYSDKIYLEKYKEDDMIDRNNPVVKIFLIVLGLFCLVGTIYYIVQYFITK